MEFSIRSNRWAPGGTSAALRNTGSSRREAALANMGYSCLNDNPARLAQYTTWRYIGSNAARYYFFFLNFLIPAPISCAARFGPCRPRTLNFLPRLLLYEIKNSST